MRERTAVPTAWGKKQGARNTVYEVRKWGTDQKRGADLEWEGETDEGEADVGSPGVQITPYQDANPIKEKKQKMKTEMEI
jgi:hypothetical protein